MKNWSHLNQNNDFSQRLYSLLRFYQTGTRETFSNIVRKALDESTFVISREGIDTVAITRLLYRRLSDFGLLETMGRNRWVSLQNGCIPIPGNSVLVFGDFHFVRNFLMQAESTSFTDHVLYEFPAFVKTTLRLTLFKVPVNLVEARLEPALFENWCVDVENFLPDETHIVSTGVEQKDRGLLVQIGELERWNFDSAEWQSTSWRETGIAFIRTVVDPSLGEVPRYFISRCRNNDEALFEVKNEAYDWKYFIAYAMLKKKFACKYETNSEKLLMPQKLLTTVPMMLRRLMCSQAMRWPRIEQGFYCFDNIREQLYTTLKTKYGCLER